MDVATRSQPKDSKALRDRRCPDYPIWYDAYKEEHDGLENEDTYSIINEAEVKRLGVKPIPSMNILCIKMDAQGSADRAKSRTVVLGNEEDTYWHKNDLYAPVIGKQSIRALVANAVKLGRIAKQCDAKNAFVQSLLPDNEVCVVIPPKGCPFSKPGTYWKLKKTLYGLRRSPRHWYQTFKKALESLGLAACPHEPCVFKGRSPTGGTIYFGTYVDDCIYYGTDDDTEAWFEEELSKKLTIDWMGELSWYLGVLYHWDRTPEGQLTVHMSQEAYIQKMLEDHSAAGNTELTPYRTGLVVDRIPHDGVAKEDKPQLVKRYQSLVGSLNWLSCSTRPDITTAVSLLSRQLQNPSPGHLDAGKHVL